MPIPSQIIQQIKMNNPNDKTLSIRDAGLSDADVEQLTALLRAHLAITVLDLSSNNISDKGAEYLATLTRLKEINLTNNNLSDNGALHLIKCEHLTSVILVRNNLHPNRTDELVEAIKVRKNPLQIDVKHNMLGDTEKKFYCNK